MLTKLRRMANEARVDGSGSDGFTLIELLIVVVIIGILAAIAIPQFSSTKEQAYVATLKSDLRNSMTQAEAYFAENGNYNMTTGDIQSSDAVTVDNVESSSSPAAFCVDMTHNQLGTESWMISNATSGSPVHSVTDYTPGEPVQNSCG